MTPAQVFPFSFQAAEGLLEVAVTETVALFWPENAKPLRALILAGSLARSEGSWIPSPTGAVLLGDAECLCLLPDGAALPSARVLALLHATIQQRLACEGLSAAVTLTPVREQYLRSLPAHIFGYELRQTGRVLWGDAQCLRRIPDYGAAALPRADAWRLLCNRLVELLPTALAAKPPRLTPLGVYPWVKLYLDMATSFLVFSGGYAPSYEERARNLRRAAGGGNTWATPALVRQVEACTAWKLAPTSEVADLFPPGFPALAMQRAEQLWCWQLAQMTHTSPGQARAELWRRWLRRQSLRSRVRGWASAARHSGLKLQQWTHWLPMAWHASPRHWIYEAAAELAFNPSPGLRHPPRLPLPPAQRPATPAELALCLRENFYRVVQSTRA
ncbi:MAG: hypothetical protein ACRD1C_11930 [Terriglobales bacterium]